MIFADPDFHAKRAERIERMNRLAAKHAAASKVALQGAFDAISMIPAGQPILVDHYSARRHRAAIARSDRRMRRTVEADKTAAYYASKASSAESNDAIFSRDPDAPDLLKKKIEALESEQAQMKAVNAAFKKGDAAMLKLGLSEARIAFLKEQAAGCWSKKPYPPYQLSNNNANIRRLKQRLARLERVAAMPEPVEQIGNGVRMKRNPLNGYHELRFDAKPAEAVREKLKAAGWFLRRQDGEWYWANRFAPTSEILNLIGIQQKAA
jgi:hypothetical protein